MKIYSLQSTSKLKAPLPKVWEFFATPYNLNEMTPDDMSFEILSDIKGKKMYSGMIINYRIKPLLNIPMRWTTEITHCEEGNYFVDQQRFGPYALWHHEHRFVQRDGYVEMIDTVHYGLPMGILGRLAHTVFVKNKLKSIFAYREKKVIDLFQ
jgi:ligand-binding SRPBCC domain-containing protein